MKPDPTRTLPETTNTSWAKDNREYKVNPQSTWCMSSTAVRNEADNMTTTLYKASPETGQKDRRMMITSPNPRRQSHTHEIREVHEGRKRQKLSHSPEKGIYDPTTRIADDAPRIVKGQESSSSDQSASRWFREINDNIRPAQSQPTELDDDPPFYMTNHANYVPTNFAATGADRHFGGMPQSRIDSENEDLRGVIDDLTIENRRLKQMMRSRPRQPRNVPEEVSQQQDRLFEVRMHGLPPEKRRELEHLLKDFATSVHSKVPTRSPANLVTTTSKSSSNSLNFMNSKAPQTDSGYASNSNSAPVSGGRIPLSDASPVPIPHKSSSTNKAVKNYLQDIPDTLLPRQNPIMSERAKSTLVVRRLEQLFTGRKAAPGDHDQPKQQQEISHSAARADRMHDSTNSKKRKAEGPREAHVLPPDSKVNLDAINHFDLAEGTLSPRFRKQDNNTSSRVGSPDQRPTRPLDLDVHRAQVAIDNIQYLRHLGMPFFEPSDSSQDNDENWMYLNLLTGLAQLHTLNVTPEFIRRAVKKLSRKFELSKDGHKVRWIGGADETKFTVEDEKVIEGASMSPHESGEDTGTGRNSNKRSQSNSTSNQVDTSAAPSDSKTSGLQTSSDSKQQQPTTSGISNVQSSNVTKPTATSSAFDYKPIVYRGKQFAEYQESYLRDSDDSFDSQSGDSSGLANAMSKSNLSPKDREEGHLTFYNNPFFFSDLSADREPSNMKRSRPVVVGEILGIPVPDEGCESPLRFSDATYFTTKFAAKPFQAQSAEDQKKLYFKLPEFDPISEAGEYETVPLQFEVSGLGGVTPMDNFALDVRTEIRDVDSNDKSGFVRKLPFSGRRYQAKYSSKIKSCDKIELLPSKLPPPSYIFFTSSSSSDAAIMDDEDEDVEDSDGSSDTSSPLVDEEFPAPPAFLQQFTSHSSNNANDDNDNEMESSDIDMLAIARKVNPEQIAEQERVYAINQPGGPGVAAVAGSLAATVGASRSGSSVPEEAAMADISSDGSEQGSMDENDEEIENA